MKSNVSKQQSIALRAGVFLWLAETVSPMEEFMKIGAAISYTADFPPSPESFLYFLIRTFVAQRYIYVQFLLKKWTTIILNCIPLA
jgi:hypothetical protein